MIRRSYSRNTDNIDILIFLSLYLFPGLDAGYLVETVKDTYRTVSVSQEGQKFLTSESGPYEDNRSTAGDSMAVSGHDGLSQVGGGTTLQIASIRKNEACKICWNCPIAANIQATVLKVGSKDKLKPIKDELPEEVEYAHIKAWLTMQELGMSAETIFRETTKTIMFWAVFWFNR
ncbi:hypothetical protein L2E82_14052 [Cichorium intybus]|uniref:Uncharacterized protein n=1 Tax=Cichorium intybus TaxID=13427 RepID=A0ACB9F071_CICIN|nr:hypothetical protein L2E82_14052 [Cichorium intybus]